MLKDTYKLITKTRINTLQVNSPIVVVCAADDKYAMPLSVTARSLLANLSNDYSILLFVIDGGIKKKNKQKILETLSGENCEVRFIPRPEQFAKRLEEAYRYTITEGQAKKYISIAQYYRIFIADLLPEQIKKAIYLDCDLVINEDLSQLWQTDLGENYVLAAQDTWIHSVSANNGLLNYQELGIDSNAKYFNSGVLVINLEKWRRGKISTKAIEYLNHYKEYILYGDQDILNALFTDQWGELDPQWNVTARVYEYSGWEESPYPENIYNNLIQNKPYIIHFVSGEKPWNSRNVPLAEHFFHYIDMTTWSGWRFTFWRELWLKLVYKFRKAISIVGIYTTN
ncbi:glycosyltransferase family 8 protein [Gloeocapsopsis crepidinum LEGE 06123]|uniref:Glycosyltransferase family 8 protein n=1 Tax=Gloeocapsopsis crepidinum LEGE 06123 TaxID=588587 RepID=A0ABR9UM12_9CHRO|nr:glycosyltransferase family 8 protein [Gloeocapsopsis crepidinum]MBE9189327.1 glycosyltransferase family 8 protein [Gloeocapsopsis crepidinum LEGE 06123]